MLGKRLPHEHMSVRNICCGSTMMLGKRLPCEHIGVRHMVWQNTSAKIGHLEDRKLFDVTEESNLRIIVSPHQNGKRNSKGVWKTLRM